MDNRGILTGIRMLLEGAMRGLFSLTAVSWLLLLVVVAAAPGASAQAGGPDIFVTPFPNAPFSGTINVERSMVHRNGSIINLKTIRGIGRDSRGRIYNESRELVPVSSNTTPQVLNIHLYDPQTRISTMLNTSKRIYSTMTVNRPPATEPPALLYASSTANGLPQNQFTKEEDLGTQEIEGVPVHGVREIQTIPAESSDTGKEIVVTDEYWYSEDLRINLVIKHSDPRTGTVTMKVTQIARTEPDPALFEIPDGYKSARAMREKKK
jgi:hypothetical protein